MGWLVLEKSEGVFSRARGCHGGCRDDRVPAGGGCTGHGTTGTRVGPGDTREKLDRCLPGGAPLLVWSGRRCPPGPKGTAYLLNVILS